MQESALGSVFIFRGRNIGLENYKSKESLSRVVVTQKQDYLEVMVIGQEKREIVYGIQN